MAVREKVIHPGMKTSQASAKTYIAVPFYTRWWLFASASGTKVQLDDGVVIEFDFNGQVVTATKDDESRQLATLEAVRQVKAIHLFKGTIRGGTFEIEVDRHGLSGNTRIVVVHRPSGRKVTLKPFGHTSFDVWPGLRIQAREFGPWAIWRKKGAPNQDDFALRDAFILDCEQEYQELGQVLVALLLSVHRNSANWD